MEIKELETQTEREMAAVILEQAIEIRRLKMALNAALKKRKESTDTLTEKANAILEQNKDRARRYGIEIPSGGWVARSTYAGKVEPTPDPMAVDVRSVV